MRRFLAAVLLLVGLSTPAWASNCVPFTFTLTNGQTADANQVMANFNTLLDCANNNLAHNGANSDITSLSGLTTPLTVPQGGTGLGTLTSHGLVTGNGTSTPTFTAPGSNFSVLQSNGTVWAATSVISSSWVPSDNSGATLVFTGVSAAYTTIGNMVFASAQLTYPTTANTSNASISGLPVNFPAGAGYGRQCHLNYTNSSTSVQFWFLPASNSGVINLEQINNVPLANNSLSGTTIVFQCIYPVS